MAKGRSTRGSAHGTPSSLTSLLAPQTRPTKNVTSTISLLRAMADQTSHQQQLALSSKRTEYHPSPKVHRPIGAAIRSATRLTIPKQTAIGTRYIKVGLPEQLQFARPDKIGLCIRRKMRKEVLHALKRTSKGARSKHRNRNGWSKIKC